MRPFLCSRGGGFQAKERAVELTAEMIKFVGGAVGAKERRNENSDNKGNNNYNEGEG